MRGWSLLAVLAAAHASACFRGDFLENTCENLTGCGGTTALASTGTTADGTTQAPTTSGDASTGSTTGDVTSGTTGLMRIEFPGIAFRIDSLTLVDPGLYTVPPGDPNGCDDIRDVLTVLINGELDAGNSNLVMLDLNFDPNAAQSNYRLYQKSTCDLDLGECTVDPLETFSIMPGLNVDAGECDTFDTTAMNPANVATLQLPATPCFRTPQLSVPLQLSPSLAPIDFKLLQLAATYTPDDSDPTGLTSGLLFGFLSREDAMKAYYKVGKTQIFLWDVISGSEKSCATALMFPSDIDLADLDNDGTAETEGVWFFINFTAERVKLFAPA